MVSAMQVPSSSSSTGTLPDGFFFSISALMFSPFWISSSTYSTSMPFSARKIRSEEHTSELQSRENLVCRLLLEKKKNSTRRKHRAITPRPHPPCPPKIGSSLLAQSAFVGHRHAPTPTYRGPCEVRPT